MIRAPGGLQLGRNNLDPGPFQTLERKTRFDVIFMIQGVCLALRALFNRFKGCSSHGNELCFARDQVNHWHVS